MGTLNPSLRHGAVHRKVHPGLCRELRRVPEGSQCGIPAQKAATASTPVMEITENEGNWTMKTSTSLKAIELKFKLGEPFDGETTDGRKCQTTVTMEGNKLITSQKAIKKGDKDVTAVREFADDKLTMSMTVDGVTSTQVYKRD